MLENKSYHIIPAYISLAAAFGALATGMHYYRISPKHYSDFPIEWVQVALFSLVLLGSEAYYQYTIKDEKPF